MRSILLLLALVGIAGCDRQKAEGQQGEAVAGEAEQREGVDRSRKGKPAPVTQFKDPDGGDISLADFRGVPVLVNLWASWCAPCVKELPTLSRLHGAGGAIQVAAISQDNGPQASVVAFLAKAKADGLTPYQDPEMKLSGALGAQILPTTILYDKDGFEVWRYVGDLDWTSPEAAKLLAEAGGGAR